MENKSYLEDEDTVNMIRLVNENANRRRMNLENIKESSLRPRREELVVKKKSIPKAKIIAVITATVLLVKGISIATEALSAQVIENKIETEITETYGSGFVEGVTNRTVNNQFYWYDYSIMANVILESEDQIYVFYNTVNAILVNGLSDSEKLNCLDELSYAIYKNAENGVLQNADCTLATASTWTSFLRSNNFFGEDDIEARKVFQKFVFDMYVDYEYTENSEVVR